MARWLGTLETFLDRVDVAVGQAANVNLGIEPPQSRIASFDDEISADPEVVITDAMTYSPVLSSSHSIPSYLPRTTVEPAKKVSIVCRYGITYLKLVGYLCSFNIRQAICV